jgi:hypothetical protein
MGARTVSFLGAPGHWCETLVLCDPKVIFISKSRDMRLVG